MTEAIPMPTPPTMRQIERSTMLKASPDRIPETTKSAPAISMTLTRPIRSARVPATHAPTAEPSSAEATAKPVWLAPTLKCFWMPVTAPLITELSYPNRKPPIAAAAAMNTTYLKLSDFPRSLTVMAMAAKYPPERRLTCHFALSHDRCGSEGGQKPRHLPTGPGRGGGVRVARIEGSAWSELAGRYRSGSR